MSISNYIALFSLIGTTYGGDGKSTFALPDFRGRVPVGSAWGQMSGSFTSGEKGGTSSVTLLESQIPLHQHTLDTSSDAADYTTPDLNLRAVYMAENGDPAMMYQSTADTFMNPSVLGMSGGNSPHSNMQPYLCVSFIICLEGMYPIRPFPQK
jgi:microcystin-dependent protein